jgi:hypothetical protein
MERALGLLTSKPAPPTSPVNYVFVPLDILGEVVSLGGEYEAHLPQNYGDLERALGFLENLLRETPSHVAPVLYYTNPSLKEEALRSLLINRLYSQGTPPDSIPLIGPEGIYAPDTKTLDIDTLVANVALIKGPGQYHLITTRQDLNYRFNPKLKPRLKIFQVTNTAELIQAIVMASFANLTELEDLLGSVLNPEEVQRLLSGLKGDALSITLSPPPGVATPLSDQINPRKDAIIRWQA